MARVDEALQPEAVRTIAGTILQVVPVFLLSLLIADRRGLADALQRKKTGQPSDQRRRNRHTLVSVQFHFLSGLYLLLPVPWPLSCPVTLWLSCWPSPASPRLSMCFSY